MRKNVTVFTFKKKINIYKIFANVRSQWLEEFTISNVKKETIAKTGIDSSKYL